MDANDYARGYTAEFSGAVWRPVSNVGRLSRFNLQAWDREPKKITASTVTVNQNLAVEATGFVSYEPGGCKQIKKP